MLFETRGSSSRRPWQAPRNPPSLSTWNRCWNTAGDVEMNSGTLPCKSNWTAWPAGVCLAICAKQAFSALNQAFPGCSPNQAASGVVISANNFALCLPVTGLCRFAAGIRPMACSRRHFRTQGLQAIQHISAAAAIAHQANSPGLTRPVTQSGANFQIKFVE